MTEEELKKALFDIRLEYMMHTPKEKEVLYEEYAKKLEFIRKELIKVKMEKREKELKIK